MGATSASAESIRYWGEDDNPNTLNRYVYVHHDPINFYDPTGHWEQGDEKLSTEDQRKIKSLTDAYVNTVDRDERDRIHKEANQIRKQAEESGDLYDDDGDSFAKAINKAIASSDKVDKKGEKYITADAWKDFSEAHDRRSKGKNKHVGDRYNVRGVIELETVIKKSVNDAKEKFDYNEGSKGYKEELDMTYYEKVADNFDLKHRDLEGIQNELNDVSRKIELFESVNDFDEKLRNRDFENEYQDPTVYAREALEETWEATKDYVTDSFRYVGDQHKSWDTAIDYWTLGLVSQGREYAEVNQENPYSVEQFLHAANMSIELFPALRVEKKILDGGEQLVTSTNRLVTDPKVSGDAIISNGRVTIDTIKANPAAFSGKNAEEVAQMLGNQGLNPMDL